MRVEEVEFAAEGAVVPFKLPGRLRLADGLIVRAPHAAPARAGDICRVLRFQRLGG